MLVVQGHFYTTTIQFNAIVLQFCITHKMVILFWKLAEPSLILARILHNNPNFKTRRYFDFYAYLMWQAVQHNSYNLTQLFLHPAGQPVVILEIVFHSTQTHTCYTIELDLESALHFLFWHEFPFFQMLMILCQWDHAGQLASSTVFQTQYDVASTHQLWKAGPFTHLKEQNTSSTKEDEAKEKLKHSWSEFQVWKKWKFELPNNCCLG